MKGVFAVFIMGILLFGCTVPPSGQPPQSEQPGTVPQTPQQPVAPQEPVVEPSQPGPEPEAPSPPATSDRLRLVEWFVVNKLMGADGGVPNGVDGSYASSSIWMVMEYALEANDEALFRKEYGFLMDRQFDSSVNLVYAELDAQKSPKKKDGLYYSSTGDNLRIAKALLKGKDKWGGTDYSTTAKRIGDSLVVNSVYGQILVKESYWSGSGGAMPASRLRTADAEWEVMNRFIVENRAWVGVTERTRSHTLGCTESGFFWPEYNAAAPMCDYGPGNTEMKTTDSIQSAAAFADMDAMEPAIMTYTKISNEYNRKYIISNAYTIPFNGVGNMQSDPGTYAAMGTLAVKLNRCDFAGKMRDEVLESFVSDSASPLYGSIARDGVAHASDNLRALLFLRGYADVC